MYYHRFVCGAASDIGMPALMFRIFKGKLANVINLQGYGRHTREEVYAIGKQDLEAFENLLGNNAFLFGEKPCNEDAVLFTYVAQIVYFDKGPLNKYLRGLEFIYFDY
jgi:hypothetical protein